MRLFALFLIAVGAVLSTGQRAEAAFSFSLSPASSSVGIGGTTLINVIATDTQAAPFGTQFTMSSATLNVGAGASTITFTNFSFVPGTPPTATIFTATASGNIIGSITAAASGSANNGDTRSVTFTGVVSAVNGLTFTPGSYGPSNSVSVTAVPEPSSMALVGLAGLGVVIRRRRRA